MLKIERLQNKRFGPVDLELAAGECLCLSGPSGSGKSSLLRAIADLEPHKGRVALKDTECRKLPAHQWRRKVSLLPAETQWWEPTVGDHFRQDMRPRLADLNLEDEVLDWEVDRLSSGEKQRLALLRLLANQPGVLLLDEPTANLDPENTTRVERVLADYRKDTGAALLWVSHDPEQIERVSDRHLHMDEGRFENSTAGAKP